VTWGRGPALCGADLHQRSLFLTSFVRSFGIELFLGSNLHETKIFSRLPRCFPLAMTCQLGYDLFEKRLLILYGGRQPEQEPWSVYLPPFGGGWAWTWASSPIGVIAHWPWRKLEENESKVRRRAVPRRRDYPAARYWLSHIPLLFIAQKIHNTLTLSMSGEVSFVKVNMRAWGMNFHDDNFGRAFCSMMSAPDISYINLGCPKWIRRHFFQKPLKLENLVW